MADNTAGAVAGKLRQAIDAQGRIEAAARKAANEAVPKPPPPPELPPPAEPER